MFVVITLFTILLAGCATTSLNSATRPFGYEPIYTEGSPQSHFDSDSILVSHFPANIYGNETSGFSFGALLPKSSVKTISYEVMFAEDFDFVRGGKLPGLCGGRATGGIRANGTNGFSARLMWREGGRIVSYVYHVNQAGIYGDDFQWRSEKREPLFASRGVWHQIKMSVGLNDPGKNNGFIRGYYDGALAIEKSDFNFRTADSLKISWLCFNTFFGGNDATWAPKKEQKLMIRNLRIEDSPK